MDARKTQRVTVRLRRNLHRRSENRGTTRYVLGDDLQREEKTTIAIRGGEEPTGIRIRRAANSYFPVYFYRRDDGQLFIADTVAFLRDQIDEREAALRQSAQLDHLVFGRMPATGLLAGLEAVDHGEEIELEPGRRGWKFDGRRRYDRFFHGADYQWRERLEVLGGILKESMVSMSPQASLFSGGVDSTLLRSLMDDEAPMISARIPGQQFAPEVEQATKAANLFAGQHRFVDIDHRDYPALLADVTRCTGVPCPAMQHVLQAQAAAAAAESVAYGELGDGTYGLPFVGDSSLQRWFAESDGDVADAASRVFSVASMRDDDASFDRILERVYGAVDKAHRRRAERIRQLVDWSEELDEPTRRWGRFLICGHAADFLTVGCVAFVRDYASSRGVVVQTPYTHRQLMDEFHRLDPATRYGDGEEIKPVLKTLLARQLPPYRMNWPKLGSGLPRSWYFTEGPLGNAFERYPVPPPMDGAVREAIESPGWSNSWILWPALSYAVWYHEWLRADSVPEREDMVEYMAGSPLQKAAPMSS